MLNPIFAQELETVLIEKERQQFKITDLASLTWAMRKLKAIEQKKEEVNAVADQEIEHIEQYRKSELNKLAGSEEFFKSLIHEYAIRKRTEDPMFKSQKTPYGSIGFRKQQPKWHYDDNKIISYLKQNGLDGFLRIKEELDKKEIKNTFRVAEDGRVIDPNGQVVEGIKIEFLPEKLDVKVGE